MIKGVVFDFDGLIINSEPLAVKAWEAILADYEVEVAHSVYKSLIGVSHEKSIATLLEHIEQPVSPQLLNEQFWSELKKLITQHGEPMPGFISVLEGVQERGLKIGVASNSPTDYVYHGIDALNIPRSSFSSCIFGADKVENSKPAPDVYLKVVECLQLSPHECLALEDSSAGARAAVAAGMRCVLIPNPEAGEFKVEGVHTVYPTMKMLYHELEKVLFIK